jgi:hypothetical protein
VRFDVQKGGRGGRSEHDVLRPQSVAHLESDTALEMNSVIKHARLAIGTTYRAERHGLCDSFTLVPCDSTLFSVDTLSLGKNRSAKLADIVTYYTFLVKRMSK